MKKNERERVFIFTWLKMKDQVKCVRISKPSQKKQTHTKEFITLLITVSILQKATVFALSRRCFLNTLLDISIGTIGIFSGIIILIKNNAYSRKKIHNLSLDLHDNKQTELTLLMLYSAFCPLPFACLKYSCAGKVLVISHKMTCSCGES